METCMPPSMPDWMWPSRCSLVTWLDERRHRRDAVDLVEGHGVDGRHGVGIVGDAEGGEALERLGGDDAVRRVDLPVLAVEADLDVALLDDVAPRAADAQVDLADLPDARSRSPTSA